MMTPSAPRVRSKRFSGYKKTFIIVLLLVLISPVFGVILADMVGYHEPLDVAAEVLNLSDLTEKFNWTPFLDYTIPGFPVEVGYIISGLLGVGIILSIGFLLNRLIEKGKS